MENVTNTANSKNQPKFIRIDVLYQKKKLQTTLSIRSKCNRPKGEIYPTMSNSQNQPKYIKIIYVFYPKKQATLSIFSIQ